MVSIDRKQTSGLLSPRVDPDRWDQFVDAHPRGSCFHLNAMAQTYRHTPGYESAYRGWTNPAGKVVAIFPAVVVKTLGGMASNLASRTILFAEPICDDSDEGQAALRRLIVQHRRKYADMTLFAEVRPLFAAGPAKAALLAEGYKHLDYLNYVVDLQPDPDTLFSKISKSTRNNIRRSFKRGLEIEVDNTHAGIDRMYPLLVETYHRSQVPLADVQLFHQALDRMPADSVQIRLVKWEGEDVSAGIGLVTHQQFYAWYAGSKRIAGVAAFDCLTWDEIRCCSEAGLLRYDFGGAGWPDKEYGPREFKAKFGGDLVHYGRYRKVNSPWKLSLAESAYNLVRNFISPSQAAGK